MKHLALPLACLAALAACGRGPSEGPQVSRLTAERPARAVIKIHYRDRATLDKLARGGVDLFENVDPAKKTVGATLTSKAEAVLKQFNVPYDVQVATLENQAFPEGYKTLAKLAADMQAMAKAHPTIAHEVQVGKSLEGRPIMAMEICAKPGTGLPAVRIGSGQHARELPPVEMTHRFMHQLVDGYAGDPQIKALVDTRDIWVVPVVNPDGRAKVEAGESMWRKNTRPLSQGAVGVDTNRNADIHWEDGNNSPWSEAYRGPSPFSEPESQAMRDLCTQQRFKVSIDIHNYSGMILWPPGYTSTPGKDEARFKAIGDQLNKDLNYKEGQISTTIYVTDGDLASWEYEKFGTLAFAAELDDTAFNPDYGEVDRDWRAWSANLLYLCDVAGNPQATKP
jgi:hypothetical protein